MTETFLDLALQQTRDRVGTAQRLETAEAKASAFVFVVQAGDTDLSCQTVQSDQRGPCIAGPG